MITYKVWVEVESHDDETDEYCNRYEPISAGVYHTPGEAEKAQIRCAASQRGALLTRDELLTLTSM